MTRKPQPGDRKVPYFATVYHADGTVDVLPKPHYNMWGTAALNAANRACTRPDDVYGTTTANSHSEAVAVARIECVKLITNGIFANHPDKPR